MIVTSRSSLPEYHFVSRFFAPRVGVDEDPVCGSAHCCLGPYWAEKLDRSTLVAHQVSCRGGVVKIRMAGPRVVLDRPSGDGPARGIGVRSDRNLAAVPPRLGQEPSPHCNCGRMERQASHSARIAQSPRISLAGFHLDLFGRSGHTPMTRRSLPEMEAQDRDAPKRVMEDETNRGLPHPVRRRMHSSNPISPGLDSRCVGRLMTDLAPA